MKTNASAMRLDRALLNSLLIGYVCTVYLIRVGLLLFHSWLLNAIEVILTVRVSLLTLP